MWRDIGSWELRDNDKYWLCHMPTCVDSAIRKDKQTPSCARSEMPKIGHFKKRLKDADKIRLHLLRHHFDEYRVNIDAAHETEGKEDKEEDNNLISNHRNTNSDLDWQVLLPVRCGTPWNVVDYSSYVEFMKNVWLNYVKISTLRDNCSRDYTPLIDTPIKDFFQKAI